MTYSVFFKMPNGDTELCAASGISELHIAWSVQQYFASTSPQNIYWIKEEAA